VSMATDYKADTIKVRIPDATRGAEIGVHRGKNSADLLAAMPGLRMLLVDPWPHTEHMLATIEAVSPYASRVLIAPTTSSLARNLVADEEMDFVYIDGNHSQGAIQQDIKLWWPTIKPGGWLCGHDYWNPEDPAYKKTQGVCVEVDAFCERTGLPLERDRFAGWFVRKPEDWICEPS